MLVCAVRARACGVCCAAAGGAEVCTGSDCVSQTTYVVVLTPHKPLQAHNRHPLTPPHTFECDNLAILRKTTPAWPTPIVQAPGL
jgi:hypothetical protein